MFFRQYRPPNKSRRLRYGESCLDIFYGTVTRGAIVSFAPLRVLTESINGIDRAETTRDAKRAHSGIALVLIFEDSREHCVGSADDPWHWGPGAMVRPGQKRDRNRRGMRLG